MPAANGTTPRKTLALSGGQAQYTTSKLSSGKHNITAAYKGSTSFDSRSPSLTQTVN
ncbi:MAG: Ig-like domain repeat protein [Terriglobales bacterium]